MHSRKRTYTDADTHYTQSYDHARIYTHVSTNTYIYTRTLKHTRIQTHTHIHIYTCIHIHIYTTCALVSEDGSGSCSAITRAGIMKMSSVLPWGVDGRAYKGGLSVASSKTAVPLKRSICINLCAWVQKDNEN